VVGLLLFFIRRQLGDLKEISLPGGSEATFEKQLEKARREIAELTLEAPNFWRSDRRVLRIAPVDSEILEMAEAIPEYLVIACFADVEKVLVELKCSLPDLTASSLRDVVHEFGPKEFGAPLI